MWVSQDFHIIFSPLFYDKWYFWGVKDVQWYKILIFLEKALFEITIHGRSNKTENDDWFYVKVYTEFYVDTSIVFFYYLDIQKTTFFWQRTDKTDCLH